KMHKLNDKLQKKLSDYQELFDHNQRMIVLGNKFNDAVERYFNTNKKRPLVAELLRLTESENAKRKKKTAAVAKKEREQKKKTAQVLEKEIVKVRKEKKTKKKTPKPAPKPKELIQVGDQVRLTDGQAVGIVEIIEKKRVVINYGAFTTKANLEQLEFVQRPKK
ncbi:MAG: DNA mismatch repair protein MutS, partial [Flavobacteriaceae bacterium]